LVHAAVLVLTACNSVFDIHEGTPRPICADELMIDDLEDGDAWICETGGRGGPWYTVGDATSTDLTPAGPFFEPTLIEGGERGTSRYAAHFSGSGFTDWGAFMGFNLKEDELGLGTFNASATAGIKFWMKSDVPIFFSLPIPETSEIRFGGACSANVNCSNDFGFSLTAPLDGWTEYEVPFSALRQWESAIWDPRALLGVHFGVPPGAPFDVWVDDVQFYHACSAKVGHECVPTCSDPEFPVPCPESVRYPASCHPPETDCARVASWCADPLLIDDLEDHDNAICDSGGRKGWWYVFSDGTSTDLEPAAGTDLPTAIPEGERGPSRSAARFAGSGFTDWGAGMGFDLDADAKGEAGYDASSADGISFFMKSNVEVSVRFPLPETIPVSEGGSCEDDVADGTCHLHFGFTVGSTANEWREIKLPFAALSQGVGRDPYFNWISSSEGWDATRLRKIEFSPGDASDFEVWVDDLRFYTCESSDCLPSCLGDAPVACAASPDRRAGCWPAGTDCSSPDLTHNGVWGSGPSDVWVVGQSNATGAGTFLHWDGSDWTRAPSNPTPPVWDVWGSGADDVWAVAEHGTLLRHVGLDWIVGGRDVGTRGPIAGIWGTSPSDAWAISNVTSHWDGREWSTVARAAGPPLLDIWGNGADDVWAVGYVGTIVHWDGAAWSASESGTEEHLTGVWGSAENDVWVVGTAGLALHWDGTDWTPVETGATRNLEGIWGSGPDDIWAVGQGGTLAHWDGLEWALVPSGTPQNLWAVWGSGASDVWAVGDLSTILHYDGDSWSASPQ
jgi:hypothetical protein